MVLIIIKKGVHTMLSIYTVSFFGHRIVENFNSVEMQVEKIIFDLISSKEYVRFLVGRNGDFDQIVASSVRRVKKQYRDDNSCLTLFLPYQTAELRDNMESFEEYYDEIQLYSSYEKCHYKSAITKRNYYMIDSSDLVVACIQNENGGAFTAYKYALKTEKKILRIK